MAKKWRGSFAIPMTPYTEDDTIDVPVLEAELEFCIESNVGGIMAPLMVSEFRGLSEAERKLMMRVPVEVSAGRVPIIVNVAATNKPLAVEYAKYAQEIGADGVIAMPPYIHKPDYTRLHEYFAAINEVVDVPIMIQNASVAALSPEQLVRLCEELEHVSWVKEEVPPGRKNISRVLEQKSPAIKGVMGGDAGRPMMMEHLRGSDGVIHACQICDVLQKVWDLLDAGDLDAAGELFEHMLPTLLLERNLGMAYAKEIMVRRGIFKNHRMRNNANPIDEYDMKEVDRVWERIQPYLTWHKK